MKLTKGAKNVKIFYKVVNAIYPFLRAFNKNYLYVTRGSKSDDKQYCYGYHSHTVEVRI
jgi:hypothetical protein